MAKEAVVGEHDVGVLVLLIHVDELLRTRRDAHLVVAEVEAFVRELVESLVLDGGGVDEHVLDVVTRRLHPENLLQAEVTPVRRPAVSCCQHEHLELLAPTKSLIVAVADAVLGVAVTMGAQQRLGGRERHVGEPQLVQEGAMVELVLAVRVRVALIIRKHVDVLLGVEAMHQGRLGDDLFLDSIHVHAMPHATLVGPLLELVEEVVALEVVELEHQLDVGIRKLPQRLVLDVQLEVVHQRSRREVRARVDEHVRGVRHSEMVAHLLQHRRRRKRRRQR
mmetsp:Transcript_10319/g.33834  ORF Transcript_10319/g.33834 Transcript_10319/m.33834 type:complete len:279 (-) Transcript_10319:978-1814(-)